MNLRHPGGQGRSSASSDQALNGRTRFNTIVRGFALLSPCASSRTQQRCGPSAQINAEETPVSNNRNTDPVTDGASRENIGLEASQVPAVKETDFVTKVKRFPLSECLRFCFPLVSHSPHSTAHCCYHSYSVCSTQTRGGRKRVLKSKKWRRLSCKLSLPE